jgi:hypothetical protein
MFILLLMVNMLNNEPKYKYPPEAKGKSKGYPLVRLKKFSLFFYRL